MCNTTAVCWHRRAARSAHLDISVFMWTLAGSVHDIHRLLCFIWW